MKHIFHTTLIFILLLCGSLTTITAQNGYSVADAIPVTSFPTTFAGVVSDDANNLGAVMGGVVCSALQAHEWLVYKVVLEQEGALRMAMTNYVGGAGAIITFTENTSPPTTWSDLTYLSISSNICGLYTQSSSLGEGYDWNTDTWNANTGMTDFAIPAGTYYVLFLNANVKDGINLGGSSDVTFEFEPYCVLNQPEIEVEGSNIAITDGDNTPSTSDGTDLGTMLMSASPITKTFTIKNVSANQLDISNVAITGDQKANFSISAQPSATVAGNSNTTFTVEFTPNTVGVNNATIEITNTDCDRAIFNFDLEAFVLGTTPSDVRGNMLTLDGSNDYVEINNVAEKMVGVESFTWETWINADATQSGNDRIISVNKANGDNRILFYLDDGVLETYTSSGNVYTNGALYTDLADDSWHHLAFTHDGTTNANSIYLDGQLVETETKAITDFLATDQWSIGQEFDGGSTGDFFKGKFDEVRIWKDVRTLEEIRQYKHLSFTTEEIIELPNLVAYYQFDNDAATGTVDGVKDILGNHGEVKNGGVYSASEVAVGGGVFERQNITVAGVYIFSTVQLELEFITAGVPNGDIEVTKITTENPINVSIYELANAPTGYWIVNNYGASSSVAEYIKFKFDDGQIDYNIAGQHKVHQRGSNDAGSWTTGLSSNVSIASGDNYIKKNDWDFGQFRVSSSSSDFVSVLPVELTYFKGRLTERKTTELTWQTATEINNQGFEIQRSTDSREWENIGYKSGNGTSIHTDSYRYQNYEFTDFAPLSGISYYRLKQMDFDGQFDYSNIVSIDNQKEDKPVKVYPTVVKDHLTIENGQGTATIFNLLGQPIQTYTIKNAIQALNVSDLSTGQYFIHIIRNDGKAITKRFVK